MYDQPLPTIQDSLKQQNLRNRVSYTEVINLATQTYPAAATYYSYDIQGNVDTVLQDFGTSQGIGNAMNRSGHRFKKIAYDYDLISGKVNQVSYQPGKRDAYYHRYDYDAENRLTQVISGRDSIMLLLFPEREANYEYYAHGPLARTRLGKLNVQGLDYAYTLQGWLKGINPTMGGSLTNGTDTTEAKPVAQDVFGFSLHYYRNDYRAIWYTPQASSVIGALTTNAAPLYNGNIATMAVNIPRLSNTKVYNYKYDQLNRLVAMDLFNGLNPVAGTFTASVSTEYQERISYDPNGNIRTYQRNGDAARLSMDNLTYSYKPNTNQLHKVVDAATDASAGVYPNYNDLRTGQADNNYVYDAIGNLVQDAKDTITNITWNVYGKIESITKNAQVIRYSYDASGNRISKATTTDTTFYVRDASGNVLSVYSKPAGGTITQDEVHLYGSSRLGMTTRHVAADTNFNAVGAFGKIIGIKFTRGEKLFELSNHLGNVLVTVADRVVQVIVTSDTVRHYLADVRSANDYYPFGMQMPGRKFNAGSYRMGFNGKENDTEVKGTGNQQDYGFRVYDPRIAKFQSGDPLTKSYPMLTPYQFASNSPIAGVDFDGLEFVKYDKNYTSTIVFPSNYAQQNDGGILKKEFEYAMQAHMNVLIGGTMSDINKYLSEKGTIYDNILFTGHGGFNSSSITMGNHGYKLNDLELWKDQIKDLAKHIKKDGSIILLACYQATPKYTQKDFPYRGELYDINLDGESLTKKLSAITGRSVVGNAGETYSGYLEFSGSYVQSYIAAGQLRALSQIFAGKWSITTPDQKIESLGPIILNPDGTYKLSKTNSSSENNISDATINETKKEGPKSPAGN